MMLRIFDRKKSLKTMNIEEPLQKEIESKIKLKLRNVFDDAVKLTDNYLPKKMKKLLSITNILKLLSYFVKLWSA